MISSQPEHAISANGLYAWVGSPNSLAACARAHTTNVSGLIAAAQRGSSSTGTASPTRDRDIVRANGRMRLSATRREMAGKTDKNKDAARVSSDRVSPCLTTEPPCLARRPLWPEIKHAPKNGSMRKCKAISNSNCKLGCALEGPPSACGFGKWAPASLLATNWRSQTLLGTRKLHGHRTA
jgi:hypothetical protein